MSPADDSAIAVVDIATAAERAEAIRRHWHGGEPFVVLDPADPPARRAARLEALRRTPLPPQAALVAPTSGTTGSARLVVHSRDRILAACRAVNDVLDVDPDRDRWLACVPLHFVAGLAIVLRGAVGGTPVTVHDRFDVDAVGRAAGDCTLVSLVATQLQRLLDAGAPLERFRAVLLGGGPIPGALVQRARERGVTVHTTYGMTETFGGCVHDGHPLSGVELAIEGARATGEILVRGPVMLGYLGAPDETARAFTVDGALRTGDVGFLDAEGALHVVDRLKDLVISGGVNVSPSVVESVLSSDPAVADVAVIGATDDEWGERVVACVVPADRERPPVLAELQDRVRDRLSPSELPRELRIVEAIPRTGSGKIRRADLSR